MRIVVTGFDPFGGETVNPAYEAVKLLPDRVGDKELIKIEIPTAYRGGVKALEEAIERYQPDAMLSIGQAGGAACIRVERIAVNLAEARIPDNEGYQPVDKFLREDGENAYFSTLPVKEMQPASVQVGYPSVLSYSAGTYVCNAVMYNALYLAQKHCPSMKAGFIHVPYAPQQVIGRSADTPSMPVTAIAECLRAAIGAIS